METLKIVVSGPVGAGKTTLIRTLSETEVVETDVTATEAIGKEQTTVAMDYGSLRLEDRTLYLFGMPGQERFDFMWELLLEGSLGMIMLVRGDKPQDFVQARRQLDYLVSRRDIPFVIGVTRQDVQPVWAPNEVAAFLGLPEERTIGLVATEAKSALVPLLRLLEIVVSGEKPFSRSG